MKGNFHSMRLNVSFSPKTYISRLADKETEMDFSKIDLTASVDDDLGQVPEPSTDFEILDAADYAGYLKEIRLVEKSRDRIERERIKYPDKEPEPQQYEWIFQITEPGFEDRTIRDWTSLTWRPPKSQAYKYARVLYGRELEPGEMVKKSKLVGVPCRITLIVYKQQDGTQRNYIDSIGSLRKPTPKATPSPELGYTRRFMEACQKLQAAYGWTPDQIKANIAEQFPGYQGFKKLHADAQKPVLEWVEARADKLPETADLEF